MNNLEGRPVPGYRAVPRGYYERQIHELNRRIKELENKVDELQERIDQYEWAMGIGE